MTDKPIANAGGEKSPAKASNNDTTGKGFTGVWIPAYLYQHTELSASDREVLGIIKSLSSGGFVSVKYVANVRGIRRDTQSKQITKLEKLGFVKRQGLKAGQANQIRLTNKAVQLKAMPILPCGVNPTPPCGVNATPPCGENPTPPVGKTPHNNKEIIKGITKEIVNDEYTGVRSSIRQRLTDFINLWKWEAESGEWPVLITDSGRHSVEYFGEEVQIRLNELLADREPRELIDDIRDAVIALIEKTHDWASADNQADLNQETFGIVWHLNALDNNEGQSRPIVCHEVNQEAHCAMEPTGESTSASDCVPVSESEKVNQGASPLPRYARPPVNESGQCSFSEPTIRGELKAIQRMFNPANGKATTREELAELMKRKQKELGVTTNEQGES